MKNLFDMIGLSYRAPAKGDSRRASYTAVPVDRAGGGRRRRSYGNNRRQSLDPAAVLGRHVFDGRLADPRTRNTCESARPAFVFYTTRVADGVDWVRRRGEPYFSAGPAFPDRWPAPKAVRSGAEKVGNTGVRPSTAGVTA